MSEDRPFFHGWRARTHYLTRDRRFLLRTAAAIIACGMIGACVIVIGGMVQEEPQAHHAVSPALSRLHGEFHRLRHEKTPQPRPFATWLRMLLAQIPKLVEGDEEGAFQGFIHGGKLGGYEVAQLIQQHATTDAPAGLFQDFLAAALHSDEAALEKLEKKTRAVPPEMLAAELLGSVQKRRGDSQAAMQAFYTEGLHFADASAAREEALRLAVTQRDLNLLRSIATQPGWIEHCHPLLQHHAGALLGDVWMQWHGLIRHRLNEIPYGMLALAFFVAALWYFILVQHSDRERWRWARPIAALMAGVCSVWPTLTILAYQEFVQGMTANAPFPHDLIYYLVGVGLREEGCKLLLFALFLPWLLWRRQPGLALLTGAFVGLGFSLEENIGYYQDYGGTIAWTRFLSANFLHISLTGICAHSLYHMLRTRFARAGEFITTFLLAVAAHGGYDFLATGSLDDNGWLSIVVLVVSAARFIDLLAAETRPVRLTIAPRAVFTFGSATLIAISFILGAWTTRSMEGVATAGQECLSMVPIALLYWRKFENV
ncbi:PrsW family glutamic-type intramembrane protease [Prosthecobacter sp.]|uniref:PrsW family glutamic-type intramembrane protease n=1 Tax=Prosthecobacter sp. TaxID=1965333 RepID=UPI002AB8C461|nr:PrsW family glutamic-type intramembrane protease [Prosthecobacter sp.]MDZ4405766.1 PrsW family glutamic-type intramembrane protease [Prosthecobacter sp.]